MKFKVKKRKIIEKSSFVKIYRKIFTKNIKLCIQCENKVKIMLTHSFHASKMRSYKREGQE